MKLWKLMICCLVAVAALGILVRQGIVRASDDEIRESAAAISDTVMRRARQCYVIEGAYPQNLSYLEENYGLTVNHEKFLIVYDAFAENLPPKVIVRYKGG